MNPNLTRIDGERNVCTKYLVTQSKTLVKSVYVTELKSSYLRNGPIWMQHNLKTKSSQGVDFFLLLL